MVLLFLANKSEDLHAWDGCLWCNHVMLFFVWCWWRQNGGIKRWIYTGTIPTACTPSCSIEFPQKGLHSLMCNSVPLEEIKRSCLHTSGIPVHQNLGMFGLGDAWLSVTCPSVLQTPKVSYMLVLFSGNQVRYVTEKATVFTFAYLHWVSGLKPKAAWRNVVVTTDAA